MKAFIEKELLRIARRLKHLKEVSCHFKVLANYYIMSKIRRQGMHCLVSGDPFPDTKKFSAKIIALI